MRNTYINREELSNTLKLLKSKNPISSNKIVNKNFKGFFPDDFSDVWEEKEMISTVIQGVLTVAFTAGEEGHPKCSLWHYSTLI